MKIFAAFSSLLLFACECDSFLTFIAGVAAAVCLIVASDEIRIVFGKIDQHI